MRARHARRSVARLVSTMFMSHMQLFRQRRFGFGHVDDRHQAAEQQEQREEQTKRANQHRPVNPGRLEVRPSTG